ncbi:dTMP kinase [Rubrimonas cliftonensis]|uniref:Thymidylate kinase n=1 Tax=Rubrimonas cliftonensis TaxID=89524 RepID=A0A1H3VFJ9_9RHOB|nr:dTMP kinase [Rubrimonas cliftonensis]SDZ73565.1 thymidylate kinase [Rubrimonas cliftonensis]
MSAPAGADATPLLTGRLVTLEGVDGAGKSTQARLLAEALRAAGATVTLTREPGGAPGAEAIRRLLVEGEPGRWSALTEVLLFTAARRDHLERTLAPALAAGNVVICDRFVDSTRAYQSAGRGEGATAPRETVDALHRLCIGRDPDLTLVLDLDPAEAAARDGAAKGAETRFEAFGGAFQTRLRAAFRAIAEAEPARCALVDAAGAPDAVARRLRAVVFARLGIAGP